MRPWPPRFSREGDDELVLDEVTVLALPATVAPRSELAGPNVEGGQPKRSLGPSGLPQRGPDFPHVNLKATSQASLSSV